MNIANIMIDDMDIDTSDNDMCDTFVESAHWIDTGIDLTGEELDELQNNHSDWIYEVALDRLY